MANVAIEDFLETIRSAGLQPPSVIELGKIYRFPGLGKGPSNRSARCKLFPDGLGGWWMDFSDGGEIHTWQAQRAYTPQERTAFRRHVAEAQAQAEADQKARWDKAAADANRLWESAKPATQDHPYLRRKGIQPYGRPCCRRCAACAHHGPPGANPLP
jgi:putative DNA primase/helicase